MDRRTFLTACPSVALSGCVGVFAGDDQPMPGDITCSEELPAGSSNEPGDGSWTTELHDMQNTGHTDASGPSGCVEAQWTWSQNPQAGMSAGPVIADGRSYVPHQVIDDISFVVLDARSGEQQWEYSEFPLVPWFTPTLTGDTLYLVSMDAIDAVDLQTRTSRWHTRLSGALNGMRGLGVLRVTNGMVYVGANAGVVLAFDAQTGERRWRYDVPGISKADVPEEASVVDARVRGKVNGPLAVDDQRVYASSWDYSLYALDATTGEQLWQFSAGTDLLNDPEAPVISDENVYVQTKDARLFVLDAATGTPQWKFDEIGRATHGISPIVEEDAVYITAGTSTENLFLVALRRDDHSVRWKHPIGPPFQDPVGDAQTIYIDYGGALHAIDRPTGNQKWELQLQQALAAPATIIDSATYATDVDGTTYAVW